MMNSSTWRSLLFLVSCYRPTRSSSSPVCDDSLVVKQSSSNFKRVSLSDVSDPSSSWVSVDDLMIISSSFHGPKLHSFTLAELEAATSNFSRSNLIGGGGFGPVYKGFVDDKLRAGLEAQPVAVKALNLDGFQGHKEWLAEIIFLGQLRHPHLVTLVGYCCEDENRLLVYEYMTRGSLENQLFRRFAAPLAWSVRMKIALGAAKGLAFLHEAADQPVIIYRDFKSSNILLDADYNAKLSDFGLAKDGPQGEATHVTTRVMGTQGYAAPEYIMTGHLTTKSDVYSFGVVLLELITGRRSYDNGRARQEQSLVEWARPLLRDPRRVERLVDPRLEGQFSTKGALKLAALAYRCLSHHPKARPGMSYVVSMLDSLQGFHDTLLEPFVYVVPLVEEENTSDMRSDEKRQVNIFHGWRHMIRLPRSSFHSFISPSM